MLRKARKGTRVIYIPGNHDEMLRDYAGMQLRRRRWSQSKAIHETADGRRMLVIHGDAFDGVVHLRPLARLLGDKAYDLLLAQQLVQPRRGAGSASPTGRSRPI